MKNGLRNTVFFVAGSVAIAALFLANASTARAAGLGELQLASRLGEPLELKAHVGTLRAA